MWSEGQPLEFAQWGMGEPNMGEPNPVLMYGGGVVKAGRTASRCTPAKILPGRFRCSGKSR